MIKIGQKVTFNPFVGLQSVNDITRFNGTEGTEGTVKYVNATHHWFSVEYGDPKMVTSFKFSDIGKAVKLV